MKSPSKQLLAGALLAYSAVMVSLTMLKSFFLIGLLWEPAAHRNRSVSLAPLNDFGEPGSWFSPLFGYGGNFAFFVPFGVLLYALLDKLSESPRGTGTRPLLAWPLLSRPLLLKTTLFGALFSVLIECAQYAFRLGYSDIDDVIFNALGALCGAIIAQVGARILGKGSYWIWVVLALFLAVIFAVLVALGPRLGDPDKVVDVGMRLPDVLTVELGLYP